MFLIIFLLAFTVHALYVGRDGDLKLYLHQTAVFGPLPRTYDVEAELVLADPLTLCTPSSNSNLNGKIVLALRGNCTFLMKAQSAQTSGAKGLIVGNYNLVVGNYNDSDALLKMGSNLPEGVADPITIPSVFISFYSYQDILTQLQTTIYVTKFESQSHASDLTPQDSGGVKATNRKIVNQMSPSTVKAILNKVGEASGSEPSPSSEKIKIAGIFLLSVPALWCTLAGAYLIRRHISERIARYQRSNRAADIPLVTYRQMSQDESQTLEDGSNTSDSQNLPPSADPSSSPQQPPLEVTPSAPTQSTGHSSFSFAPSSFFTGGSTGQSGPKVHNESCAICLDDFRDGSAIKVLPCHHGFHSQCIDPWLNERSDLCPICKTSILTARNRYSDACCALCCFRPPV